MCDYIRVVQSLNVIHQEGGCPCEPTDLPPDSRHLDFYLAAIRLTDKMEITDWRDGKLMGVRHVGRRYDNPANTQSTPSFTLVDAALRYDNGPWRFALNIANLFDKRYVASRAYGGYYLGAERNFTLMAKYRF